MIFYAKTIEKKPTQRRGISAFQEYFKSLMKSYFSQRSAGLVKPITDQN